MIAPRSFTRAITIMSVIADVNVVAGYTGGICVIRRGASEWRTEQVTAYEDLPVSLEMKIMAAIKCARKSDNTDAEWHWIEKIEELRKDLISCHDELDVIDFGARSSRSRLTAEEMYRGARVRKSVGEICVRASRTKETALLLFHLIRQIKPRRSIELGTSLGISTCYQAAALKLNGRGRMVTLEGAESLASVARRNFTHLALDNVEVICGRFQDILAQVISGRRPIDYAFIDGHHDGAATLNYYRMIMDSSISGILIVLDDIHWSQGMEVAWKTIQQDRDAQFTIQVGSMGLVARCS